MKSLPAISIVIAWIMVCLGFGPVCLHSQTYNDLVPDSVIIQFRNEILQQLKPPGTQRAYLDAAMQKSGMSGTIVQTLLSRPPLSDPQGTSDWVILRQSEMLASLLSEADLQFMREQVSAQLTTEWAHPSTQVRVCRHGNGKPDKPIVVTMPLFNRDHTLALVYYERHCGPLCGDGACTMYKRNQQGRWEPYSNFYSVKF